MPNAHKMFRSFLASQSTIFFWHHLRNFQAKKCHCLVSSAVISQVCRVFFFFFKRSFSQTQCADAIRPRCPSRIWCLGFYMAGFGHMLSTTDNEIWPRLVAAGRRIYEAVVAESSESNVRENQLLPQCHLGKQRSRLSRPQWVYLIFPR